MIKAEENNISLKGTVSTLMAEFGAIVDAVVLDEDEGLNEAGSILFEEDWDKLKEIAENLKKRVG